MRATYDGNPAQHDTGNEYDRLARYARLMTVLTFGLGVAFLVLVGFTWSLFPLKRVEPYYVYFSDAREQVVRIDRGEIDRNTLDLIVEKFLKEYVHKRETINGIDESTRYPWLQRASSTRVFELFRKQMDVTDSKSPLRQYAANSMSRDILVTSAFPNDYARHIYTVEFTFIDRQNGREFKRGHMVATIEFETAPLKTQRQWQEENPLGLTITAYEIRFRQDQDEATSAAPPATTSENLTTDTSAAADTSVDTDSATPPVTE